MYVITVLLAASVLVVTLAHHPSFDKENEVFAADCAKEFSFDLEILKNAKTEFPDSKNFRCYLNCFMVKTGCMTADGALQKDLFTSKMSAKMNGTIPDSMAQCANIKMDDACDTAYGINKCIFDAYMKMIA